MAAPPLVPIVVGRGAASGDWDDGSHTGVKQICLEFDDAGINFFQAFYIDIDQTKEGSKNGTQGVTELVMIPLDFPGEYITNVSGYIIPGQPTTVRSLTFKTNRTPYGPYGGRTLNQDIPFEIPIDGRFRIVGFRGAFSGNILNAFGVNISQ
ncbi:hypothetical protein TIFTF001_035167 [Ficus carica]|uniref:Jacalin-type lectin domain-containing protein n=1 Tax=Ficus carica TaxID=3494 RepID=A0AA88J9G9_FICCA|nr:hypothetical protein TIFTF001_035167 [Ficus carica]